ncbi:MAG TPA: hydrogenase maturation protease [Myxococcaceae bacterium]|nr:hydrogenase maturation protease [Myxococcaceae bacterium]
MSGHGRTLVAGVGNVFLGDDGFGVEVAQRLASVPLPPGVEVRDFGIGGVHLAYQLLEGYDTLVLVDAVGRDAPPGTLFVIEPDPRDLGHDLDAHGFDPASVLELARTLGTSVPRVLLVGCVPAEVEERLGLSPPVERAVEEALRLIPTLLVQHSQLEELTCLVGSS